MTLAATALIGNRLVMTVVRLLKQRLACLLSRVLAKILWTQQEGQESMGTFSYLVSVKPSWET